MRCVCRPIVRFDNCSSVGQRTVSVMGGGNSAGFKQFEAHRIPGTSNLRYVQFRTGTLAGCVLDAHSSQDIKHPDLSSTLCTRRSGPLVDAAVPGNVACHTEARGTEAIQTLPRIWTTINLHTLKFSGSLASRLVSFSYSYVLYNSRTKLCFNSTVKAKRSDPGVISKFGI